MHYAYRRRSSLTGLSLLFACLLAASPAARAAVWQQHEPHGPSDTALLHAPLHRYRALTVDLDALHAQLAAAPRDGAAAPVRIELPMPDGTLQAFAVRRVDVMAPALAARFPEIRSYAATAIGHPDVQARIDDSPLGFSAMIRGSEGVAMIQPVTIGTGARYIAFDRHDVGASDPRVGEHRAGRDPQTEPSHPHAPWRRPAASRRRCACWRRSLSR